MAAKDAARNRIKTSLGWRYTRHERPQIVPVRPTRRRCVRYSCWQRWETPLYGKNSRNTLRIGGLRLDSAKPRRNGKQRFQSDETVMRAINKLVTQGLHRWPQVENLGQKANPQRISLAEIPGLSIYPDQHVEQRAENRRSEARSGEHGARRQRCRRERYWVKCERLGPSRRHGASRTRRSIPFFHPAMVNPGQATVVIPFPDQIKIPSICCPSVHDPSGHPPLIDAAANGSYFQTSNHDTTPVRQTHGVERFHSDRSEHQQVVKHAALPARKVRINWAGKQDKHPASGKIQRSATAKAQVSVFRRQIAGNGHGKPEQCGRQYPSLRPWVIIPTVKASGSQR